MNPEMTEREKARMWDAYAPLLLKMLHTAREMMPTRQGGKVVKKRVQFVLDASALCGVLDGVVKEAARD